MGVTASHVLSATTPDDPSFEIQPKHWNSVHAMTLNAVGSEISGAFGNGGGITFGLSADGKLTAAAPAGVPSPVHVSAGASEGDLGTIIFSNSNGLAFGLDGSAITGSYTQSTHAHPYRNSTDAVGLNTALTANGVSWTVNSDGISLNVPAFLTTAALSGHSHGNPTLALTNLTGTTASASNGFTLSLSGNAAQTVQTQASGNIPRSGFTTTAQAGTAVVGTHDTDGLKLGVPAFLTTARASTDAIGLNTALTANGVAWTVNSSGLSLNVPAFLTTARASTDGIGLNTAQTNVTWTVNSSGLSFNAAGYAGTATTFNGANISGSITQNSAGINLSLSVAAPGAAAENNAINLLGANTAGNTTATGSTIGWSGLNVTLSGANNSQVVISAPATSSIVGTSGMSISSNGSTISVQPVPMSQWSLAGAEITAAGSAQANSLVSIQPFLLQWPVAFSNIRFAASINVGSAANNSSAYIDLSISGVVYTRNASTLSSLFSFSNSMTQTWSSNATGTVTGVPAITATCVATTLTPGDYWMAVHVSTANSATGGAATTALGNTLSMILAGAHHVDSAQNLIKQWGAQTADSQGLISGQGILSTGATRATIAFSDYVASGTRGALAGLYFGLRNATYQG